MWNIKRATRVGWLSSLVVRVFPFFPQGLRHSSLEYRWWDYLGARVVAFHVKHSARPVRREDLHGFPCGECWVILMLVGGCVSRETRIGVLGLSAQWLLLGRVWWGYAFR